MKVVAFVPVKLNNERTPGKNTKRFSDGTPLIQCILRTLVCSEKIDEVYVYCSREEIKEYLVEGVSFLKRNPSFDRNDADVNRMFQAFARTIEADIYVLAHATAPFQKAETIEKGIEKISSGKYDSAFAVKRLQEFIWKEDKPVNYSIEKIPRTQDLDPLFTETTGLYIFRREVILTLGRRIGRKPFLLEVDEIESVDINQPIDFAIADAIREHMINKEEGEK